MSTFVHHGALRFGAKTGACKYCVTSRPGCVHNSDCEHVEAGWLSWAGQGVGKEKAEWC